MLQPENKAPPELWEYKLMFPTHSNLQGFCFRQENGLNFAKVMDLDWEDPESFGPVDMVLASEVIYQRPTVDTCLSSFVTV